MSDDREQDIIDIINEDRERLAASRDELVAHVLALLTAIGQLETVARDRYAADHGVDPSDDRGSPMIAAGNVFTELMVGAQRCIANEHMHIVQRLLREAAEEQGEDYEQNLDRMLKKTGLAVYLDVQKMIGEFRPTATSRKDLAERVRDRLAEQISEREGKED